MLCGVGSEPGLPHFVRQTRRTEFGASDPGVVKYLCKLVIAESDQELVS